MTEGLVPLVIVIAFVFGANVIPAFGPPTWIVLVYFRVTYSLPIPLLVVCGAMAAAAGRWVLAIAFRHLGSLLPQKRREGLHILGGAVSDNRIGLIGSLAFFAVSPLPSSALFEAVGLARVRLSPLLGAFVVGRLASYSFYLIAAAAVQGTVKDVIADGLTSPRALALGMIGVVGLAALVLIDWIRVIDAARTSLARTRGKQPPPSIRGSTSARSWM